MVQQKLDDYGIHVVSIQDPLKVIPAIKQIGARVVLLDIDMPVKDGLTLLHEIKLFDAGIQVIMCTGMVSLNTVLQATSLGAEACIFKPINDLNEITAAVDRAFEKIDRWWIALDDWLGRRESFHVIENQVLTP
jgi:DNA-binding NtrC family response regulator